MLSWYKATNQPTLICCNFNRGDRVMGRVGCLYLFKTRTDTFNTIENWQDLLQTTPSVIEVARFCLR